MGKKFKLNCVPCANGSCITPAEQKHLVFSNDPELTEIDCDITAVKSIRVENCENLTILDCLYKELTSLEIINCPSLTSINCYDNFLSELDISSCPNLVFLDCSNNNLSRESVDNIVGDLLKSNQKNGTLLIEGASNSPVSSNYWEYLGVLNLYGWTLKYNM